MSMEDACDDVGVASQRPLDQHLSSCLRQHPSQRKLEPWREELKCIAFWVWKTALIQSVPVTDGHRLRPVGDDDAAGYGVAGFLQHQGASGVDEDPRTQADGLLQAADDA